MELCSEYYEKKMGDWGKNEFEVMLYRDKRFELQGSNNLKSVWSNTGLCKQISSSQSINQLKKQNNHKLQSLNSTPHNSSKCFDA